MINKQHIPLLHEAIRLCVRL